MISSIKLPQVNYPVYQGTCTCWTNCCTRGSSRGCSYSVYAGSNHEFVVQFRLKSLELKIEISSLACRIYSCLVPPVSYHGQMGEDVDGKETLSIYVRTRVNGISHLGFVFASSPRKLT